MLNLQMFDFQRNFVTIREVMLARGSASTHFVK